MTEEAERTFTEFLSRRQLKFTPQRRTILMEAFGAKGHFSAEELLETAKKRDHSISKATLYRTLSLLTEAKLLEEHDFGGGHKSYERHLGHTHHDHMICIKCRRILEFESPSIEEMQEAEAKKRGFQIIFHSHKLFGLCSKCG